MDNSNKTILVTGATGRQGGATARRLLDLGFHVRALTRHPDTPAAHSLADQGAEIIAGSLDDRASLRHAMQGCYGVFSVQEAGFEREIRQGTLVADLAKSTGVPHLVYTSVASCDRRTGLPHFDSKWKIEQHIHRLKQPSTILRPVFFMQNWKSYYLDSIMDGTLAQPLDPGRSLQQIDVEDIGSFAAMAFNHPEHWVGRTIELAGDQCTMPGLAKIFGRILNRPVQYVQVPWNEFSRMSGREMTLMYQWFNKVGYSVDLPALRREYPRLSTLEQCLGRDWKSEQTLQLLDRIFI